MRLVPLIACAMIAGFVPPAEDAAGLRLERSKPDGARPGAIETVAAPVRSGDTAIRFTIRAGDCVPDDCAADRERVELKARETERAGTRSVFGWAFFLPADFAEVWPAREFIAQIHQEGGEPAMLFSLEPHGLVFESRFLDGPKPLLIGAADLRGRWHTVELAVDWAAAGGSVRVTVDGEVRVERNMATMSEAEAYFKIGLYRAHVSRFGAELPEQVMVVDDVRRSGG